MTRRPDPGLRVRAAIAIVVAIPVLALVSLLADPGAAILVWSYLITGFLLVVRRPRQPVAWMLVLAAVGLALGSMHVAATLEDLEAGTADAVGSFTAWANGVGWNLVFAGFTGIGLLFPTGSMPRGRWGVVAWVLVIAFVPFALANTFGPSLDIKISGYAGTVSIPNPAGWAAAAGDAGSSLFAVLFVLTVVAQVSLLARFRVSTGVEHLQYRWLVYALLLVVVATLFWVFVMFVLRIDSPLVANTVVLLSYPAVPVAVVIAVLRYRLYEIDRLVSRSLGWGIATAMVLGVSWSSCSRSRPPSAGSRSGRRSRSRCRRCWPPPPSSPCGGACRRSSTPGSTGPAWRRNAVSRRTATGCSRRSTSTPSPATSKRPSAGPSDLPPRASGSEGHDGTHMRRPCRAGRGAVAGAVSAVARDAAPLSRRRSVTVCGRVAGTMGPPNGLGGHPGPRASER